MLKHYVEFLYPGAFFCNTSEKEVFKRDPKLVSIPDSADGFRFIDREEVNGADGEKLKGENKNISGWYYQGRKMTLEDVKTEMPEKKVLISNMEINGWENIVLTKSNKVYPLDKGDMIIS